MNSASVRHTCSSMVKVPLFHVMLTSYEIASKESHLLRQFNWESMIVDEAHRLKAGARGQVFQALHTLRTRHRCLLTGTPLQNTLDELFHLLFFLEPQKFKDIEQLRESYQSMETEANE